MARPKLRRYTTAIGIMAAATLCMGCIVIAMARMDGESRTEDLASIAQEIASKIDCRESEPVYNDIYFWDEMYGVNCYQSDGKVEAIRVYRHPSSVAAVLQDWQPLISPSRPLVTGANWFVIGPRKDVEMISDAMQDALEVTVQVPPPPPPLAPDQKSATTCLRFAAGSLNDRALNPNQYKQMLPYLETKYPGYRNAVDSSMSPEQVAELKKIATYEESRIEAYLSKFGSKIKKFCTAHLAN
ncbi:hypothetical protein SAMN05421874_1712 [Nonomuraea maritima]|uniref:Uncharacterized protein n=1 Tax=Nonomuraea maritima TaxID=683260 RepID=A0A1G9SVJ1_9ACTN|nr:hypothetical protein [Nonomuraea maritima]SDM39431.1 hypothetical protein SAMN05421874_1712 [Nonomuraea maritima]